MKSILVILAICAVASLGHAESAFKCPQTYLSELKPVTLKNFYGIWYVLRWTGCEDHKYDDVACSTQAIWRTKETAENTVHSVCAHRINGTYEVEQGVATVKPVTGGVEGQVDNHWTFQLKNMTFTSVFVDSDNGQNWGIGHTCAEENGNATSMWAVMSRTKTMDAKLEQQLVEKIEKWSGLTQDKLRGIQQTDCYKVDENNVKKA